MVAITTSLQGCNSVSASGKGGLSVLFLFSLAPMTVHCAGSEQGSDRLDVHAAGQAVAVDLVFTEKNGCWGLEQIASAWKTATEDHTSRHL